MALDEGERAGWRGNHPRLLDCISAQRWQPFRALPQSRPGRMDEQSSLGHERGRRDRLPGAVRRLHFAAADARYDFHRDRNWYRSNPVNAALAARPHGGRTTTTWG